MNHIINSCFSNSKKYDLPLKAQKKKKIITCLKGLQHNYTSHFKYNYE